MKKFLFLFLFFSFIWAANATWNTSQWVNITDESTAIITVCTLQPWYESMTDIIGMDVYTFHNNFWFFPWWVWPVEDLFIEVCWPNSLLVASNPVTDLANTTWSGARSQAVEILTWPIGKVLQFIIAITILWIVAFAVRKFIL